VETCDLNEDLGI